MFCFLWIRKPARNEEHIFHLPPPLPPNMALQLAPSADGIQAGPAWAGLGHQAPAAASDEPPLLAQTVARGTPSTPVESTNSMVGMAAPLPSQLPEYTPPGASFASARPATLLPPDTAAAVASAAASAAAATAAAFTDPAQPPQSPLPPQPPQPQQQAPTPACTDTMQTAIDISVQKAVHIQQYRGASPAVTEEPPQRGESVEAE